MQGIQFMFFFVDRFLTLLCRLLRRNILVKWLQKKKEITHSAIKKINTTTCFYFENFDRKRHARFRYYLDARSLRQDDSWTGRVGTAAQPLTWTTTTTNSRFLKRRTGLFSPSDTSPYRAADAFWVYQRTLTVNLADICSFFFPPREKKDPCPDVPAVFGFSHGVDTFSEAGYSWCLEGRRRPLGSTAHPTLTLTIRPNSPIRAGKWSTTWLCNKRESRKKGL